MKYLISLFACNIFDHETFQCLPNVKYVLNCEKGFYLLGENSNFINLNDLPKVLYKNDEYYLLIKKQEILKECFNIKSNKNYQLNIGTGIKIYLEGEKIFEVGNINVSYSHFEEIEDKTIIYFEGKRNYVIVLHDNEILFSNYYDEINILDNERVFMSKLYDTVNHGKVCSVGKKIETYLVYLDDYEMKLKKEFLSNVFVDCLVAGNYNYCNSLLDETLKQGDAKNICKFFNNSEKFIMIEENAFVGIEKNAIKGIFRFEVDNLKIKNIIEL